MSEEQQKHQLDVWVEDGDKSLQQFSENMEFTTVLSKKKRNMDTFRTFLKRKRDAEKEKDETLKAKKWERLFKKYKM